MPRNTLPHFIYRDRVHLAKALKAVDNLNRPENIKILARTIIIDSDIDFCAYFNHPSAHLTLICETLVLSDQHNFTLILSGKDAEDLKSFNPIKGHAPLQGIDGYSGGSLILYYKEVSGDGFLKINTSGGDGGRGQRGYCGQPEENGEDGGPGGNGGDSGFVKVISTSQNSTRDIVSIQKGGYWGKGGRHGIGGDHAKNGQDGKKGLQGKDTQPIHKKVNTDAFLKMIPIGTKELIQAYKGLIRHNRMQAGDNADESLWLDKIGTAKGSTPISQRYKTVFSYSNRSSQAKKIDNHLLKEMQSGRNIPEKFSKMLENIRHSFKSVLMRNAKVHTFDLDELKMKFDKDIQASGHPRLQELHQNLKPAKVNPEQFFTRTVLQNEIQDYVEESTPTSIDALIAEESSETIECLMPKVLSKVTPLLPEVVGEEALAFGIVDVLAPEVAIPCEFAVGMVYAAYSFFSNLFNSHQEYLDELKKWHDLLELNEPKLKMDEINVRKLRPLRPRCPPPDELDEEI